MGWRFTANCHVQVWISAPPGVLPPVAAATYDGPGQLVVPKALTTYTKGLSWHQRLVIPYAGLNVNSAVLKNALLPCYVRFVNDTGPTYSVWWIAVDQSPATLPDPATPGNFLINNVFYSLESV